MASKRSAETASLRARFESLPQGGKKIPCLRAECVDLQARLEAETLRNACLEEYAAGLEVAQEEAEEEKLLMEEKLLRKVPSAPTQAFRTKVARKKKTGAAKRKRKATKKVTKKKTLSILAKAKVPCVKMSKGALVKTLAEQHKIKTEVCSRFLESLVVLATAEVKTKGIFMLPGLCVIRKPATKAKSGKVIVKAFAVAALKSQI